MKRFLLALAATVISAACFAQSRSISLILTDSATRESVPFATVSLVPSGASKASKYVLTDENGAAKIEKVQKGTYTIKAELLGYKPYSSEVTVADKDIDLGSCSIEQDTQLLDAASISAVGNPITVKKDTIEYNAASFKTTDNDMLEQLLKKLPGVEVASDGTVTSNGKTISKITIDGKTFFLDDPSLATKNIPAKIVEKVKVVDKKSDQAMFTGIDDGEEETVIDLSIKKGMMNGWFGNIMGGGGHDIQTVGMGQPARWQGAAMVGNFKEKSQISIILNGNNTNNRGFNDMAGSMMNSMRGGGGGMGRGGGMWGGNNGITTSWMAGLNGAWTLCDGDMDLAGNYLYNGTKKDVLESSSKTTFRDGGNNLVYDSDGYSHNLTQGHRFGVRLEHKFSPKTSIIFEPQFNFGYGNYDENSKTATMIENGEARDSTNKGFTYTAGNNRNWTASGFLLFRQKIGDKPGRTLSANIRYNFSNNDLEGWNQSMTDVWDKAASVWNPSYINQRYVSDAKSASIRSRIVYTEPLAENLFLELSYGYNWSRSKQVKDTYDSGGERSDGSYPNDPYLVDGVDYQRLLYAVAGETHNDTYSNRVTNNSQTHRAGAALQYQTKKLRLQAGLQFQPTITDNTTTDRDPYHSTKCNWSPRVMFNYDFSDNSNIRLFYRGNTSQPSINQLLRVPDNSNPLHISFGNQKLDPYFTHSLRTMYGYTNRKTFFSFRGNLEANLVQNGITNATWYDAKGVQYSMPLNGPLTANANLFYFLNSPIAKSNFSVSYMSSVSYTTTTAYVGKEAKSDWLTSTYYVPDNAEFKDKDFYNDFLGKDAKYKLEDYFVNGRNHTLGVMERLKFTYRNDFVELSLGGRTRFSKPWYAIESASEKMTWANQVQGEMLWTIPGGVGINADARYNWYVGYTTPQESECILNAEITKLLFKNRFTLALKCYDILNQSKTLTVKDTENYHSEVRNNTLGRYVILSLTYRFGNFGKSGQQMRQRSQGGPGGPGGHGGMGGPRVGGGFM